MSRRGFRRWDPGLFRLCPGKHFVPTPWNGSWVRPAIPPLGVPGRRAVQPLWNEPLSGESPDCGPFNPSGTAGRNQDPFQGVEQAAFQCTVCTLSGPTKKRSSWGGRRTIALRFPPNSNAGRPPGGGRKGAIGVREHTARLPRRAKHTDRIGGRRGAWSRCRWQPQSPPLPVGMV